VEATSLPLTQVVTHGSIRIGFLEGFTLVSSEPDLLLAEANRLDVDVLCWGGTHKIDAFEYMDKFFVNPGSATGAFLNSWGNVGEDPTPSFCLMDVCSLNSRTRCHVCFRVEHTLGNADSWEIGSRHFAHAIRISTPKR
jgi:putative phosphoesterase